ncbi:low molecular weight protein-tyrosine-phosphatase [Comamonas aquatica]|uniref:protein-tyrosine-phosphatase n=1 Tax=Comamonas aquatica TaxID=225991 RepID=A0AA42HUC5_9BURK|nr:low molecular weight phosphotyrosine protein phosphatase [Comamonas aquatica]MDH0364483.1 low molecular weight phosphotyrosine protein phosphatase [Comamonas aquatica]
MQHILVVCIGNICRSPIAEALLRQKLPAKTIESAGLAALVGEPADPESVAVAADHGFDLSAHRAQQVTGWMCAHADLVLVMESSHQQALQRLYPTAYGKIRRLGELPQQRTFEIVDPYRKPRAAFKAAYAAISQGVDEWVRRIQLVS